MKAAVRTRAKQAVRRLLPKGEGSQHVYATLKERILALDLAPGEPLEEGKLAAQLAVSRTPVREALIRLGSERLVTMLPNRGAMVADLSLSDLRDFFETLEFVQSTTTRLAAQRCDAAHLAEIERHMHEFETFAAARNGNGMIEANRNFHVAIAAGAGNRHLYRIAASIYNEGLRVSRMGVSFDFDREHSLADHLDLIVLQHRKLVALIAERDVAAAATLAAEHNDLARRRVVDVMTKALAVRRVIP